MLIFLSIPSGSLNLHIFLFFLTEIDLITPKSMISTSEGNDLFSEQNTPRTVSLLIHGIRERELRVEKHHKSSEHRAIMDRVITSV